MNKCSCVNTGYCPVLDHVLSPRQHAICNGTALHSTGRLFTEQERSILIKHFKPTNVLGLELFTQEEQVLLGLTDPTLIGNRIKELTDRFGIPPCAGCETRKLWINLAHTYLRNIICPLPDRV